MVWNSKHHLNQTFPLCLSDWYLPSSTFALKIDWVWYLLDLFSLLKYVHFRKTIGQSSFLSKVLSFLLKSKQSQQKWQHFWKKCATVFLKFMADFRPGFCVIRFILSPQIFFTSETNTKKNWVILHKFNFSMIKFTKTPFMLLNCQLPNVFVYYCQFYHSRIEVFQNCSAFLCVSFHGERKNWEKIYRGGPPPTKNQSRKDLRR